MECFNNLAGQEMELVFRIENIDNEMKLLKKKLSELKDRRKETVLELENARLNMKIYLEQELGVNTQD